MQNNIVWNVANLKKCQIGKLFEVKKLKFKNSRPTLDIAVTQDCNKVVGNFYF